MKLTSVLTLAASLGLAIGLSLFFASSASARPDGSYGTNCISCHGVANPTGPPGTDVPPPPPPPTTNPPPPTNPPPTRVGDDDGNERGEREGRRSRTPRATKPSRESKHEVRKAEKQSSRRRPRD